MMVAGVTIQNQRIVMMSMLLLMKRKPPLDGNQRITIAPKEAGIPIAVFRRK
jgi:hypothetical protein